jgi:hypothetical protein
MRTNSSLTVPDVRATRTRHRWARSPSCLPCPSRQRALDGRAIEAMHALSSEHVAHHAIRMREKKRKKGPVCIVRLIRTRK